MSRVETMRAVTVTPEGGLRLATRQIPRPGRNEVLIRVAAAGVNRADLLRRDGRQAPAPDASDVPGLEVSGIVEAVGPESAPGLGPTPQLPAPAPGQRVCALVSGGGYADYAIAHRHCVLPVPGDLDLVEAAALPEAAFTVWDNLVLRGGLEVPKAVIVHAGASGVGTLAIQIASALDCRVFATAGTAAKREACVALGAERAFDYRSEDWAAAIAAASGGADVVLDLVGASHFAANLAVLADEGRLVSIGMLGGSTAEIDLALVARKRLVVTGSTLADRNALQRAIVAEAVHAGLWPRLARRQVQPIIHTTFDLADSDDAHRLLAGDTVIGKLVLEVDKALCAPD